MVKKMNGEKIEMNDEMLGGVCGGSDTSAGENYWNTFAEALLANGAQNIPALAQLVSLTADKNWTQVSLLIPRYLNYPAVAEAVNAANATLK